MFTVLSFKNPVVFLCWLLSYAIFFFIISSALYKEKRFVVSGFATGSALVYLLCKFQMIPMLFLVLVPIAIIVLAFLTDKKEKFKTIGSILFLFISIFLIGTLLAFSLQWFIFKEKADMYYKDLAVYEDYLTIILYASISLLTSSIFISGIIKLLREKKINMFNYASKYIFFLWSPIIHYFSFIFWVIILAKTNSNYGITNNFLTIYTFIIFIFSLLTYYKINKLEQIEKDNKNYEELIAKSNLDYQTAVLTNTSNEKYRKIKHDINNILATVTTLIELGKHDEAAELIRSAIKDINTIDGIPICSNSTVNALLSIKSSFAKENGINLKIDISENSSINIDNYDLCRIISNLLDNCIEAVNSAQSKSISFEMTVEPETVVLKTVNGCNTSTGKKRIRKDRGNGKIILNDIATLYSGKTEFSVAGNEYTSVISLENRPSEG